MNTMDPSSNQSTPGSQTSGRKKSKKKGRGGRGGGRGGCRGGNSNNSSGVTSVATGGSSWHDRETLSIQQNINANEDPDSAPGKSISLFTHTTVYDFNVAS